MTPTLLSSYLQFAITNRYNVLVKGKPGIGKTDIIMDAANKSGVEVLMSHPVVSDPTDYKGLPFPSEDGTTADFLPFGDLARLIDAKYDLVFFVDDIGQAASGVQAAFMQLFLARRINGKRISDKVRFLAATNRPEDKAAVNVLEPLKSRNTIISLEVDVDDWIKWAIVNNMPAELIAFVKFNPTVFDDVAPSRDIVNSASPRTVANAGAQQADGLPRQMEPEVFAGAAGEAFASQYLAFLDLYRQLPSLEEIIANPGGAVVHDNASVMFAVTTGLARKMTDQNIGAICTYLDRVEPEFAVACMTDATTRDKQLCKNRAYIIWAKNHKSDII